MNIPKPFTANNAQSILAQMPAPLVSALRHDVAQPCFNYVGAKGPVDFSQPWMLHAMGAILEHPLDKQSNPRFVPALFAARDDLTEPLRSQLMPHTVLLRSLLQALVSYNGEMIRGTSGLHNPRGADVKIDRKLVDIDEGLFRDEFRESLNEGRFPDYSSIDPFGTGTVGEGMSTYEEKAIPLNLGVIAKIDSRYATLRKLLTEVIAECDSDVFNYPEVRFLYDQVRLVIINGTPSDEIGKMGSFQEFFRKAVRFFRAVGMEFGEIESVDAVLQRVALREPSLRWIISQVCAQNPLLFRYDDSEEEERMAKIQAIADQLRNEKTRMDWERRQVLINAGIKPR